VIEKLSVAVSGTARVVENTSEPSIGISLVVVKL
jgi:hypothetical protein